jgi:hypothetical protein
MKTVLISGSDAALFPHLQTLIASLEGHPQAASVDIAVLHPGLPNAQLDWLAGRVAHIRELGWDLRDPVADPGLQFMKIMDARAMLPDLVPGYDIYVWIDADAWVQRWEAVDLLIQGTTRGALAAVAELHPNFSLPIPGLKITHLPFGLMYVKSWAHRRYRRFYGEAAARDFGFEPILNSGVIALRGDAPHWSRWVDSLRLALRKADKPTHYLNQIALNHAVHVHELPVAHLPSRCNWPCGRALPMYDRDGGFFVEPMLPYPPLGIVHRTAKTKEGAFDIATTDGGVVRMALSPPDGAEFNR